MNHPTFVSTTTNWPNVRYFVVAVPNGPMHISEEITGARRDSMIKEYFAGQLGDDIIVPVVGDFTSQRAIAMYCDTPYGGPAFFECDPDDKESVLAAVLHIIDSQ